jgi:hypothetical protein
MRPLTRVWYFVTIILVALVTGLAFAHVLERPAKMQYPGDLYVALQRTLYVQWGPPNIGGILEPAATIATVALAFQARRQRRAFWLTVLAAVCLLLAFPWVFFWLVAPANAAFRGVGAQPPPVNWIEMRKQWELGHTLRFGLQFLAFGSLIASLVWENTPQKDRSARSARR